ncbi:N-acyl-D-amino-acid deacylase family protein [Rhodohalobacter sp.]|uniref:N-acyl-D-amino-acid deacylase family protein n=1 Tax=Rhodohalobacter sp. TaxID=1974210 RepID=UPI0035630780
MKLFIWLVLTLSLLASLYNDSVSDFSHVEILIKNGKVLDGTGNRWYYADIGINENRIVWVGKSDDVTADEVIDASGLYVSPGFIDVHSHAGSGLASESLSHGRPLLAQGITTVMVNPDGGGSTDIAGQRSSLEEHGVGLNVAQFVPHGSVRRNVMGEEDRAPTSDELEQMKSIVEEGMKNGAFGLSSGLFYTPGAYADIEEVIDLAKVASKYNGVYSSHIRDESDYNVGLIYSVDEVIEVAEEAELPGIVSHIKALGTGVWGYSAAVVNRVEMARARGVEVYADQYPYSASSTSLSAALIPAWAIEGGRTEMLQRLVDPRLLNELKLEMEANLDRRGGAENIQISEYSVNKSFEGLRLDELSKRFGLSPVETAIVLIKEETPLIVSFNMHEADVVRFMKQPWIMTSSDGGLVEMGDGVVHPRNYGSFSRKISKYVEETRTIDLGFAIRSMTSLPATVFNLHDRGMIKSGQIADIIIFDLDRIQDIATFDEPHNLSEGIKYVLIGGKFALKRGEFEEELFGRVLNNHEEN